MIRHPFTLDHVASALNTRWRGARLIEAWSQEKYKASLVFIIDDVVRTFGIDVSPDAGTVSERPGDKRARSNTRDILGDALNWDVVMVTKHPDDRIITIWFPDVQVHIELFSGGRGNIIAVKDGIVVEALREGAERRKKQYTVVPFVLPPPFIDESATLQRSLSTSSLRLGPWYAEEVCVRCGQSSYSLVESLTNVEREHLRALSDTLVQECLSATAFLLMTRGEEQMFSLVPLTGWSIKQTFTDVIDAVQTTWREGSRARTLHHRRKQLLKLVESEIHRLQRSLDGMTGDAAKEARSERYRYWADMILSQVDVSQTGLSTIDVYDDEGNITSIPLNPERTLIENAQDHYAKARSSASATKSREERIPQIMARRDAAISRLERLRSATTIADLENGEKTMTTETLPSRDEANNRFRVFVIDERHTLYVGKNASNNDELTMRFARQNDWWMHARGSAGSHAVLRGVTTDKIPKPILEKAAAITAYYSQARNASYVSVVYTQRKFVRKPKWANVGAVVLEREQTIMVKPLLPSSNKDD